MEPSDLRGIPFKNGEQVDWAIPSLLPDEKRHGKQGILFDQYDIQHVLSCFNYSLTTSILINSNERIIS
jgi:hypothetical protein